MAAFSAALPSSSRPRNRVKGFLADDEKTSNAHSIRGAGSGPRRIAVQRLHSEQATHPDDGTARASSGGKPPAGGKPVELQAGTVKTLS